ncbi:MAG TPA: DUF5915 domain-containing protein, partial [Thermomicrobiales bacterium]|nr:DUF5915 domain-containing protein [Thermomicrobiales bacterium]
ANIKVRQPLPAILVHTVDPSGAEAVVRLKDQILEELNVKDVRALDHLGDVVTHEIQPNLPLLGPKYGRQLGAIRNALSHRDGVEIAGLVEANATIHLQLADGTAVELLPTEVLVNLRKNQGFAAAQGGGATVVLDTNLTPELVQEGVARDVVRAIQDARKQLELKIEDTITVRFTAGDETVGRAIESFREYIMREVLATSLEASPSVEGNDGYARLKVGTSSLDVAITPN